MQKTILFDLDGTLIDATITILQSFDYAFKFHDKNPVNHEHIKPLIGYTLEDIFLKIGVESHMIDSYFNAYRDFYHTIYLKHTTLLEYAQEAIIMASEFADLGVVTTKGSKVLPDLLEHLGILKYFKTLVGRHDVINPKPHAEPINLALRNLNKDDKDSRASTFMIGDTTLDALSAINANVVPLSVLCGYNDKTKLSKVNNKIFKNAFEAVEYARQYK